LNIGEKITNLRKSKRITQEQFAEQLGVTRQTISKWELDQSTPDLNYISQLSELFGVTTDYLIKGKEEVEMEPSEEQIAKSIHSRFNKQMRKAAGLLFIMGGSVFAVVCTILELQMSEKIGIFFIMAIQGLQQAAIGFMMLEDKKHRCLLTSWILEAVAILCLIGVTIRNWTMVISGHMGGVVPFLFMNAGLAVIAILCLLIITKRVKNEKINSSANRK